MTDVVVVEKEEFKIKPIQVAKAVANFDVLAATIKDRIDALNLDAMEATEDNNLIIKDIRATLNKEKKAIEDQRKMVEAVLFKEYNDFLDRYKKEIKKVYDDADLKLKEKVDAISKIRLDAKIKYAEDYFAMCKETRPISFLDTFEDVNMDITISTSDPVIRKTINEHFDRVTEALEVIATYPEEDLQLLVESFVDTRSITDAIKLVNMSKTPVDTPDTPVASPVAPKVNIITLKLQLKLTESKYRKLSNFLEENEIEWETIK